MNKPNSLMECQSLDGWRGEGKIGIVSRTKGLVVGAIGSAIGRFRRSQESTLVRSIPTLHHPVSWESSRPHCVTDERVAQKIMGKNFIGLDAVITKFSVTMTEQELLNYPEIPWSEDELNEVRDTYLLVAGHPLSITEIRAKAPRNPKTFDRYEDGWYNNQRFATEERVNPCWQLIRKSLVANSTSKTWKEQQKLILPHEEVPRACDLVYAVVLYYLVTGERLFPSIYARCMDIDSDGCRVDVGCFDADGLSVSHYWDDYRFDDIGLSSARKSR